MAVLTLHPNGDVTTGWNAVPGPGHYSGIDEGVLTPDESDYIYTKTNLAVDELDFEDVGVDMAVAQAIQIKGWVLLNDVDFATVMIKVEAFINGAALSPAQYFTGTYGTAITYSANWPDLYLSERDIGTLRCRLTFYFT